MLRPLQKPFFTLLLLLIGIIHVSIFIQANFDGLKNFFPSMKSSEEEQLNRGYGPFYSWVSFIKATTPQNSLIILPPMHQFPTIGNKGLCDYFLFPRLTAYENEERVRLHRGPVYRVQMAEFDYSGRFIRQFTLDKNFSLLLVQERTPENQTRVNDFSQTHGTFSNTSLAWIKLFLIFMSGCWIVSKHFSERSLLSFVTTSFLVGSTVMGICYVVLSLLGIQFTELLQFSFLAVSSTLGMFLLVRNRSSIRSIGPKSLPDKLAVVIVGCFFGLLFLKSVLTPMVAWDALAIWGIKAKVIFAFHDLRGLNFWGAHPQYPPLFPILMSQMAIGGEKMIHLVPPLFAFCLYAIIYDETRQTRFPPMLKAIIPLGIFFSIFFEHAFIGYANLALAVFATKAIAVLSRLSKDGAARGWFSLAVLLSGLVLIRPDGDAYFYGIAAAAFLWVFFHQGKTDRLFYLMIPLACSLLWKIHSVWINQVPWPRALWGPIAIRSVLQQWDPGPVMLPFVKAVLDPASWGMIPLVLGLLYLFQGPALIKKYSWESLFLAYGFVCIFLFLCFQWPSSGIVFLFESGVPRYLMTLTPLMFIILLKEADAFLFGIEDTIGLQEKF